MYYLYASNKISQVIDFIILLIRIYKCWCLLVFGWFLTNIATCCQFQISLQKISDHYWPIKCLIRSSTLKIQLSISRVYECEPRGHMISWHLIYLWSGESQKSLHWLIFLLWKHLCIIKQTNIKSSILV